MDIAIAVPTLKTAENSVPIPTITAAEEVSAPTTEPPTAEEPPVQMTKPQTTTTISPSEVATADPAAHTYPSRERRPPTGSPCA